MEKRAVIDENTPPAESPPSKEKQAASASAPDANANLAEKLQDAAVQPKAEKKSKDR